jgi:hypothetical protein
MESAYLNTMTIYDGTVNNDGDERMPENGS